MLSFLVLINISSPVNKEELYNLRHAQLRNIIERIFGVMKKRWDILNRAPEYAMPIQAQIPVGLAAVHNFILEYDETDLESYLDMLADEGTGGDDVEPGELGDGPIPRTEYNRAFARRDQIAEAMWQSYQAFLAENPQILEEEFDIEDD